jgi:hypothetical protein
MGSMDCTMPGTRFAPENQQVNGDIGPTRASALPCGFCHSKLVLISIITK